MRAYPNKRTGSARPRSTWKWKQMLKGSRPVTVAPHLRRTPPPPEDYMFRPIDAPGPSAGKARKKRKTKEPFYKGYGVVYHPGDIKGLTDKLHLLLAELLAGSTTVRNEPVYVLDALLRLKQFTRREYTEINNHLASASLYTDVLQLEDMHMGDLEL